MPEQIKVNGLSELLAKLDSLKDQKDVYILFTGSKDSSGTSWCPDCNDGMGFNILLFKVALKL